MILKYETDHKEEVTRGGEGKWSNKKVCWMDRGLEHGILKSGKHDIGWRGN